MPRRPPSAVVDDASFFLGDDPTDPRWYPLLGEEDLLQVPRSVCRSPKSSLSSPPDSPQRVNRISGGGRDAIGSLDFALSRRYLRDKLSSPERKKPTPAEAKRRLDLRHSLANLKRACLDNERQNRLRLAAERMRDVTERRIRKLALAEKVYETKLGQAEIRQKAHIQAIARKAENETSKVKEVSFINNLTADSLHATITERLTEVEQRIQAGRARRLEHLHGIKNRQRKKREKAMQMSERRLEMEQMAAERWVCLQARVEAVQERRQTRLLEMQRRLEIAKNLRPGKTVDLKGHGLRGQRRHSASTEESRTQHPHGDGEVGSEERLGRKTGIRDREKVRKKEARKTGGNVSKVQERRGGVDDLRRQQQQEEDALEEALKGAGGKGEEMRSFEPCSCLSEAALTARKLLIAALPGWSDMEGGNLAPTAWGDQTGGADSRRLDQLLEEIWTACGSRPIVGTGGGEPGRTGKHCRSKAGEEDYDSDDEGATSMSIPGASTPANLPLPPPPATHKRRRRKKRHAAGYTDKQSPLQHLALPCYPVSPDTLRPLLQFLESKHMSETLRHQLGHSTLLPLLLRLSHPNNQPTDSLPLVLQALSHALHKSTSLRNRLLAEYGGIPLVDAILHAIQTYARHKPHQVPTSLPLVINLLHYLLHHNAGQSLLLIEHLLLRYLLDAQLIHELSNLLSHHLRDARHDDRQRPANLRLTCSILQLLERISGCPIIEPLSGSATSVPSLQPNHPLATPIMTAFVSSHLGNTLTILSALLTDAQPSGGPDVHNLTPDTLLASSLVLRTLTHLARLNLPLLQSLLLSDSPQSCFTYICSTLLPILCLRVVSTLIPPGSQMRQQMTGQISQEDSESCLEQLLTLLGYYTLCNTSTQDTVASTPLLLHHLTNLPFRYFCEEKYKDQLFPTLASLCFGNSATTLALKNEVNMELLSAYLQSRLQQRQQSMERSGKIEDWQDKGGRRQGVLVQGGGLWQALAVRFPPDCWQAAIEELRSR